MGMHHDLLPLDTMAGMGAGINTGMGAMGNMNLGFNQVLPKDELFNPAAKIESGLDSSISSGDSKNNDAVQLQAQLMNPYNPLQQSPQLANMLQQPTAVTGNSITSGSSVTDPITSSVYR